MIEDSIFCPRCKNGNFAIHNEHLICDLCGAYIDRSQPSKIISANCPKCGTTNTPENKFCGSCGYNFESVCPFCGITNGFWITSCKKCGVRIDLLERSGDYLKSVTDKTTLIIEAYKKLSDELITLSKTVTETQNNANATLSEYSGALVYEGVASDFSKLETVYNRIATINKINNVIGIVALAASLPLYCLFNTIVFGVLKGPIGENFAMGLALFSVTSTFGIVFTSAIVYYILFKNKYKAIKNKFFAAKGELEKATPGILGVGSNNAMMLPANELSRRDKTITNANDLLEDIATFEQELVNLRNKAPLDFLKKYETEYLAKFGNKYFAKFAETVFSDIQKSVNSFDEKKVNQLRRNENKLKQTVEDLELYI